MADTNRYRRLLDLLVRHPDVVDSPKQSGEARAWCPWHPDREGGNPSLGINVNKGHVKCWVCGKGGVVALAKAWGVEDPDADTRRRRAPEEPFLSAEAAMAALAEAYRLRPETVDRFQIEPRPAAPSPDRLTRGAWRYTTAAGYRFKAFNRRAKHKYWWDRGTKAKERGDLLYGASNVPSGTETVYLVNGEPSVWVCTQAGVPAVCAFGEGNLSEPAVQELASRGVGTIRIVLDLDEAGVAATLRDAEIISNAGLEVSAWKLPPELGDKGDIADLYVWNHGDDAAFRTALEGLAAFALPGPDPLRDAGYFIRDGAFWMKRQTRDGEIDVQLTNFTATVEEEAVYDDGLEETLHVVFSGQMANGRRLKKVHVPATQALSLGWIVERWGMGPRIRPGPSSRDTVRDIIQMMKDLTDVSRRTVFNHTGWRELENRWAYIMPGGLVDGGDVDVELESTYQRYHLPKPPTDRVEAVRASFRFLDIADHNVTLPMLAFAYLAPLATLLRPAFTLWLRASTGSYKSTITALLMSHFGEFEYNTPPVTWEATPRAIERYLYDVKDALAWVDDFNPKLTEREMTRQYEKAENVLRSLGNVQGRARMQANLRLQHTLTPRALMVSTGEVFPQGESLVARILPVEFTRASVNIQRMSAAQLETDQYREAMAVYVEWLANRYASIGPELQERIRDYRTIAANDAAETHGRTSATVAVLQAAAELFAEFAADVGAITAGEAEQLTRESWQVFLDLQREQTKRLGDEDVTDQFFNVLDTLLSQQKIAFLPKGSHENPPFGTDLVGWYDADAIYLDPVAAFNKVSKWMRDENRTLGVTEPGLRRALLERGIVARREGEQRLTARLSVNSRQHRVLTLIRDRVPFSDGVGQPAAEGQRLGGLA